jgi:hypothetical protein
MRKPTQNQLKYLSNLGFIGKVYSMEDASKKITELQEVKDIEKIEQNPHRKLGLAPWEYEFLKSCNFTDEELLELSPAEAKKLYMDKKDEDDEAKQRTFNSRSWENQKFMRETFPDYYEKVGIIPSKKDRDEVEIEEVDRILENNSKVIVDTKENNVPFEKTYSYHILQMVEWSRTNSINIDDVKSNK